jgi:O-antigen/teichoic acid export membrane protein
MPESGPKRNRRFAAAASFSGTAGTMLVASLQSLLLMPLYLSAVGPRLFGAWLASGDVLVWLQSFDLGLPNLMIQRIATAEGKGDRKTAGEYLVTGTAILACVSALLVALLCWVAPTIPRWLDLTGDEAGLLVRCIRVAAFASGLTLLNWSFVGYSRAVQDTAVLNVVGVVASLAAFAVTFVFLVWGLGLWSLAAGACARSAVSILGSVGFLISRGRDGRFRQVRLNREIAVEMLRMSPATAGGGLAYVVMNQSENAVAGVLLGPAVVPILSITRKGADILRALLDMIGFATYGGFAHLVASGDRSRAAQVHAEILFLNLSLGVAAAATYMTVNPSFVVRWMGASYFGGVPLTILMAAQMAVLSVSYLVNYLYRAQGRVVEGSVALILECLVRVPLMAGLASVLGLAGIPLAATLTAVAAAAVVQKRMRSDLPPQNERQKERRWGISAGLLLAIAVAAVLSNRFVFPDWYFVFGFGTLIFALSSGVLVHAALALRDTRAVAVDTLRSAFSGGERRP